MSKKSKKVGQPNNVQNAQKAEIDKEKNIIGRTKEAREILKKMKKLYEDYMFIVFISMREILDFLTAPYRTRFIESYCCNEDMLIDKKVLVPGLYDTEDNELKYNEWCCKKIEQGQQIMKDYKNMEEKIYRYLCDYIIIEDEKDRKEIIIKIQEGLNKLEKLAQSKTSEELICISQEIKDLILKLREEKTITDLTECISREQARKYTNKIIENTIKRYPEILQQDMSEISNKYHRIDSLTDYEFQFDSIELELYE